MSGELRVDLARCIGCGACRALCPAVFELVDGASRVSNPPSPSDAPFAEAARLLCPTEAIRGGPDDAPKCASSDDDAPLFGDLAMGAERVRWSLGEIDWAELDPDRATPVLRSVVREMALSESATYSATQRFLESFFDDLDFSKWISIWFYEETRHPHVLLEWLRRVGDPVAAELEVKSRVSTPFMRSMFGTLVTNVVSEMTAAHAYRRLAAGSPEPVLAGIALKIAGDEARHAATFFRFARRRLLAAPADAARRDRARALEVISAWLGGAHPTTHPVAQMIERLSGVDEEALGLGFSGVRTRVVRAMGVLLDMPLHRQEDVASSLRELLTQRGTP